MNRTGQGFIGFLLIPLCAHLFFATVFFATAFFATTTQAYVPSAQRLTRGMAEANRAARRNQSLQLSFSLHQIDGAQDRILGKGEILSNPSGMSRLELRLGDGRVERHLLRGGQYLVNREGEKVSDPNPYLLPIPLLQAGNEETLRYVFRSLKVPVESSVLTRVDGEDAFFLGNQAGPGRSLELAGSGESGAIWLAVQDLYPLKLRLGQGSVFFVGPERKWGKTRSPSYFDLVAQDGIKYRILIEKVDSVPAPAKMFNTDWLQFLGK